MSTSPARTARRTASRPRPGPPAPPLSPSSPATPAPGDVHGHAAPGPPGAATPPLGRGRAAGGALPRQALLMSAVMAHEPLGLPVPGERDGAAAAADDVAAGTAQDDGREAAPVEEQ